MRNLTLLLLVSGLLWQRPVYGQLFTQDFSSSTIVGDYVSATPNNTQFTYINSSGAGVVISINNGALQLDRAGANGGYITRSADFSPLPSLIKVVFDLEVPSATTSTLSAAIFRFGQGYGDNNNTPANASTHSRLSINLVGGEGFQLRDIGSGSNSATFNGIQTITWWINNSGASTSYTDPNGNTQALGDDKADVYVGTTPVFDEISAVTANIALTDFKIIFDSGNGSMRFDNFLITSEIPLPVELLNITARKIRDQVQLDWTTATETNNSHFAIERSADGRDFTPIGRVEGSGTLREPRDYHFTDRQPLSGSNYYRLRQVDFDGRFAFSPVRYVVLGSALRVFPSPAAEWLRLEWSEQPEDAELSWEIFDGSGRQVLTGTVEEPGARLDIPVETLLPGAYWIRLASDRQGWTQFFLKQ